jgi:hypothetical protein
LYVTMADQGQLAGKSKLSLTVSKGLFPLTRKLSLSFDCS